MFQQELLKRNLYKIVLFLILTFFFVDYFSLKASVDNLDSGLIQLTAKMETIKWGLETERLRNDSDDITHRIQKIRDMNH